MHTSEEQGASLRRLTDFLHEVGMLRHLPRSGYAFLGTGRESVAEHSHRVAVIGYALALLGGADPARTVMLCLFHDLGEARTGDFNYVNQIYNTRRERQAVVDAVRGTGLEEEILSFWDEQEARQSQEAIFARDADQLDLILNLKRESDLGNRYADDWLRSAIQRLVSPLARELAETVLRTDHTDWWRRARDEAWWINGSGNTA